MTKAEFLEWKTHPTTKAVFNKINERIYDLQVELGSQAGADVRADGMKVGAIQALQDIQDIDFDEGDAQ